MTSICHLFIIVFFPGFPFSKERLAVAKQEILAKKEATLKEMADFKFLGPLSTPEARDTELSVDDAVRKSEALALAFMQGPGCEGSKLVLPKLLEIRQQLGGEGTFVVFSSSICKQEILDAGNSREFIFSTNVHVFLQIIEARKHAYSYQKVC